MLQVVCPCSTPADWWHQEFKSRQDTKLQFSNGRCKLATEFQQTVANFWQGRLQVLRISVSFFSKWGFLALYLAFLDDSFWIVQSDTNEGNVVCLWRRPSYVRQRWYWRSSSGQTTELTASSTGFSTGAASGKYMFSSRLRRVLTVRQPTVADAGIYRCQATYQTSSTPGVLTFTAEAWLTVHGMQIIHW